ncbi:hypothetical protein C8R45DRAFT_937231 [Mycena sanguinolenta]|nr:hypothetical protein C8R45DRAFT_937231 [Mycena sanguinolenta]
MAMNLVQRRCLTKSKPKPEKARWRGRKPVWQAENVALENDGGTQPAYHRSADVERGISCAFLPTITIDDENFSEKHGSECHFLNAVSLARLYLALRPGLLGKYDGSWSRQSRPNTLTSLMSSCFLALVYPSHVQHKYEHRPIPPVDTTPTLDQLLFPFPQLIAYPTRHSTGLLPFRLDTPYEALLAGSQVELSKNVADKCQKILVAGIPHSSASGVARTGVVYLRRVNACLPRDVEKQDAELVIPASCHECAQPRSTYLALGGIDFAVSTVGGKAAVDFELLKSVMGNLPGAAVTANQLHGHVTKLEVSFGHKFHQQSKAPPKFQNIIVSNPFPAPPTPPPPPPPSQCFQPHLSTFLDTMMLIKKNPDVLHIMISGPLSLHNNL